MTDVVRSRWKPNVLPYGISETRGFYRCECDPKHLLDKHAAITLLNIVDQSGFDVVGSHVQSFGPDHGYTLSVTLGESGAAFDCWPESGTVWAFLDYCNFTQSNAAKAEKFWTMAREFYKPKHTLVLVEPTPLPVEFSPEILKHYREI